MRQKFENDVGAQSLCTISFDQADFHQRDLQENVLADMFGHDSNQLNPESTQSQAYHEVHGLHQTKVPRFFTRAFDGKDLSENDLQKEIVCDDELSTSSFCSSPFGNTVFPEERFLTDVWDKESNSHRGKTISHTHALMFMSISKQKHHLPSILNIEGVAVFRQNRSGKISNVFEVICQQQKLCRQTNLQRIAHASVEVLGKQNRNRMRISWQDFKHS
jgi:hypothetical protein